jgi:hypothetical protein
MKRTAVSSPFGRSQWPIQNRRDDASASVLCWQCAGIIMVMMKATVPKCWRWKYPHDESLQPMLGPDMGGRGP